MPQLQRLAKRMLSQVANTSSTERCWSTYSFIQSVKRNRFNVNWAESFIKEIHFLFTFFPTPTKVRRSCASEGKDNLVYSIDWNPALSFAFSSQIRSII